MADRTEKISVVRGTDGYVTVTATVTEGAVTSTFSVKTYYYGVKDAAEHARKSAAALLDEVK